MPTNRASGSALPHGVDQRGGERVAGRFAGDDSDRHATGSRSAVSHALRPDDAAPGHGEELDERGQRRRRPGGGGQRRLGIVEGAPFPVERLVRAPDREDLFRRKPAPAQSFGY